MPKLLVGSETGNPLATIGGRPHAPPSTRWPVCSQCKMPMQFLAQLPLTELSETAGRANQVLLLFQCQNRPGLCDEWDANLGGNAAILVSPEERSPLPVPKGKTLLSGETKLEFVEYTASRGETPDDEYCQAYESPGSTVVGKLGGPPLWIQGDETPSCGCGKRMLFVAQLEERGGGGINFGDCGAGYAFVCPSCPASGKFLCQCM